MEYYQTKQIADIIGIHENTVRFYESIDFITPPIRLNNGYRKYSQLHILQCKLIRIAMKAEVLQNGLRKQAIKVVKLCASLLFDEAIEANNEYQLMLEKEISSAKQAINVVKSLLNKQVDVTNNEVSFTRKEVLDISNITIDTLRTWERNDLCEVKKINNHLIYYEKDLQRINIIKCLRLANYSLAAIHRLLKNLDEVIKNNLDIESILNTPSENDDIISVCDHLIIVLQNTIIDTKKMQEILIKIKTLQ